MNTEAKDPDEVWGTSSAAAPSAFRDGGVIEPTVDDAANKWMESASVEDVDERKPAAPNKKNMVVLVVGIVMITAVVSGAGYMFNQKMAARNSTPVESAPLEIKPLPVASVFEGVGKSTQVASPFEPAAVSASLPAVSAPVALAPAPVQASAAPAVAEDVKPKGQETLVAKAPPVKAERSSVQRASRQSRSARVEAPVVAKRVATRKTQYASVSRKEKIAAALKDEAYIHSGNVKIQSIFPQSGPNVQAWIVDAKGLQIVRVGDALRSGGTVTAIRAEKGEVMTTVGIITSRSAR